MLEGRVRRRVEQWKRATMPMQAVVLRGGAFPTARRDAAPPPNAPTGALFDMKNVVYAPNNPGGREGASMGRAHAARRPPVCGMHVHEFNQLSLLVEKIQSSHTTKPVGWPHAACRELFRTGLKSC